MSIGVILLLILVQIYLTSKACVSRQLFQVLPSTIWAAIMLIPFCVISKYSLVNFSIKQGAAISLVAVVLQMGDYVALRFSRRVVSNAVNTVRISYDSFFKISLAISILVPILHYALVRQIPLLYQISGNHTAEHITDLREEFNKLLDIPFYFKVLPNYIFTIFGPYSLIVLMARKRYGIALALFGWCLFYSLSSSADLPTIIFLGTTLLGFVPLLSKNKTRILSILAFLAILLTISSGFILTKSLETSSRPCATQSPFITTPGDKWRSCMGVNVVWTNVVMDRIGYRVFLTPIEVSHVWYQYYQSESTKKRSLSSILNGDLSEKPPNIIGNWYFVDRFPDHYKKSNASYSSIDSDAFSFGPLFFAVMLVALLVMRIGASWHFGRVDVKSSVLSGFMVAQLSFFLFQGSIQAILVSQGFVIILILYFFQLKLQRYTQNNN